MTVVRLYRIKRTQNSHNQRLSNTNQHIGPRECFVGRVWCKTRSTDNSIQIPGRVFATLLPYAYLPHDHYRYRHNPFTNIILRTVININFDSFTSRQIETTHARNRTRTTRTSKVTILTTKPQTFEELDDTTQNNQQTLHK